MDQKPLLIFIAPVQSRSGYGEHSRDIVRALLKIDKYDIKVLPIRWGVTPLNALKDGKDDDILSLILKTPQLPRKPDVSVQLTVPNEFNPGIATFNIGITAGIETTLCPSPWIEGLNRMNFTIVPSRFVKHVFENTVFTQKDPSGNPVAQLKVIKPIHVLFEGADINIYRKDENVPAGIRRILNNMPEDFVFLFVGHWLQGSLGADRKDVGMLIKVFLETFRNQPNPPALLLKTGNTFSKIDEVDTQAKIEHIKSQVQGKLPNIYLLFGELTAEEMNGLYNHSKVKAHVSFTKGEGFGRPLLEACFSEKPIIASAWSGHMDFLPADKAILLPGKVEQVHPSAVWQGVIEPESSWFNVNYGFASNILKNVWKKYQEHLPQAKVLADENKKKFSFSAMVEELDKILEANVPKISVQKTFNLPTLPKLKPVEQKENTNEIQTQDNTNSSPGSTVPQ